MPTPPRARPARTPDASRAGVADRLHSVAIHLLRRLRREDEAEGLSAPRLSALSVIVFGGPLSLGELAAAEQVQPPTMSRLVTALEREGLVRREAVAGDARSVGLRATAKGERLLARGRARRVATLTRALEALDAADARAVQRAVEVLEALLGRDAGHRGPARG